MGFSGCRANSKPARERTKQSESEGGLDVVVTVDRGRHRLDDALADALVAREGADRLLVVLREAERGEEVFLLVDVVRLEHGREDGEAVLDVERRVKVVAVNARDLLRVRQAGQCGLWLLQVGRPTISSPGLAMSMRSQSRMTSRWRGRRPAGTDPGDSCSVIFW